MTRLRPPSGRRSGPAGVPSVTTDRLPARGMKVLIVEDAKKVASLILRDREARGFVVDVSNHGDEGYTFATTRPYDVVVLAIMLPGRDGLSIFRNLRKRGMDVPVIWLTARSELHERLEGFNLGADDYLTKPFPVEELGARIQALGRRAFGNARSLLKVEDLTLNLHHETNHPSNRAIPACCFAFLFGRL